MTNRTPGQGHSDRDLLDDRLADIDDCLGQELHAQHTWEVLAQ